MSLKTILASLTLTAALALPSPKNSGDITYYAPGLGACGGTNADGDHIVAISHLLWDSGSHCGHRMRITGSTGSIEATVVDKCPGCDRFSLDVSPVVFEATVGQLGVGRDVGSWQWM